MIGMVVSTWIKTGKKLYGNDKMDMALTRVGLNIDKRFSPLESVDDGIIKNFMLSISEITNTPLKQIWTDIGTDNLKVFVKNYPLFFMHKNLYGFLKSLNEIHKTIVERIPGSKPPFIDIVPISKRSAIFTYQSKRGMFDYMLAMINAAAAHFGETIKIEIMEQSEDTLKAKFTFENDIYYKKIYSFNKILSLGFIKRIEVKIGLIAIISLFFSHGIGSYFFKGMDFLQDIIGVTIACLLTAVLISPINTLKKQLENLTIKNYLEDIEIESNDQLEVISKMIRNAALVSSNSVVSIEGVADEVNEFNHQFEERLANSYNIFKEITDAVEQVSVGANQQAQEAGDTVQILTENTYILNKIVTSQNESQSDLTKVVKEINDNHKKIEQSTINLQNVTEKFSELNSMSTELHNEAENILDIVSTVTSIAEETSLLSLNASIEAARAGEAGKGFSVVAEEIGKLSSNSKDAAVEISQSLANFIEKINELTAKVDNQYIILNEENDKLMKVADSSSIAATNVAKVSLEITGAISEITNEIHEAEKIYGKVEALVSIGEENAAMAEQVHSSVTSYLEEIHDIVDVMKDLQKITDKFAEGITNCNM